MKAAATGLRHSHRACGQPWRNALQPTGRTGHPSSQGLSRARLPAAPSGQPCPEVGPCSRTLALVLDGAGGPPLGSTGAGVGQHSRGWRLRHVSCGKAVATALSELPCNQSSVVGNHTGM